MSNLETRVSSLEDRVIGLARQYDELVKQGTTNHGDINKLSDKLDEIRKDIKEELRIAREYNNSLVPRTEMETRFNQTTLQVNQVQESISKLVNDINDNTRWTIGTFLTIIGLLVTVASIAVLFVRH